MLGTGRARSNVKAKSVALSDGEYFGTVKAAGANGYFEDPKFLEAVRRRPRTHCGAGTQIISIDELGRVFPCQIIITPEISAGNVRLSPLTDIMQSAVWWQLKTSTVDTTGPVGCSTCTVKYICGGGCKAKLYYEQDRFDGPDGLCTMWRQSVFAGLFKTADAPGNRSVFSQEESR